MHITQGDHVGKGVIISWVTPDEPGSSTVIYWAEGSEFNWQAHGFFLTYKYFNYTSGYIHHCTIHNLEVRGTLVLSLSHSFFLNSIWVMIATCSHCKCSLTPNTTMRSELGIPLDSSGLKLLPPLAPMFLTHLVSLVIN